MTWMKNQKLIAYELIYSLERSGRRRLVSTMRNGPWRRYFDDENVVKYLQPLIVTTLSIAVLNTDFKEEAKRHIIEASYRMLAEEKRKGRANFSFCWAHGSRGDILVSLMHCTRIREKQIKWKERGRGQTSERGDVIFSFIDI